MFIAPRRSRHAAPLGAGYKPNMQRQVALRWSAGLITKRDTINIVLLRSTSLPDTKPFPFL